MSKPRPDVPILAAMPGTRLELIERTGLHRCCIAATTTAMHREGKCHITGWVKTKGGGSNQAIYTAGPGVDAPCKLKPKSHAKKCKQWRERCKKQGKPINNARDLKRKAASHGWAAALF